MYCEREGKRETGRERGRDEITKRGGPGRRIFESLLSLSLSLFLPQSQRLISRKQTTLSHRPISSLIDERGAAEKTSQPTPELQRFPQSCHPSSHHLGINHPPPRKFLLCPATLALRDPILSPSRRPLSVISWTLALPLVGRAAQPPCHPPCFPPSPPPVISSHPRSKVPRSKVQGGRRSSSERRDLSRRGRLLGT